MSYECADRDSRVGVAGSPDVHESSAMQYVVAILGLRGFGCENSEFVRPWR